MWADKIGRDESGVRQALLPFELFIDGLKDPGTAASSGRLAELIDDSAQSRRDYHLELDVAGLWLGRGWAARIDDTVDVSISRLTRWRERGRAANRHLETGPVLAPYGIGTKTV